MSDEDEGIEVDPVEDGQIEDVEGEFEDLSELDLDNFANHTVVVKVDGEDVRISVKEALAGYQRQADYSRKTQALAEEKKDLQWAAAIRGALDNDPRGTIELLSNHYGITRAAAQQMVDDAGDPDAGQQESTVYEQRLARLEQREAELQLQGEVQRLQGKYGEDFDPQEVVAQAFKTGSRDLETTYKLLAFDRGSKSKIADASNAAAKKGKQDASVVSGGTSSRGGEADPPIRNITDAYRAAQREQRR